MIEIQSLNTEVQKKFQIGNADLSESLWIACESEIGF